MKPECESNELVYLDLGKNKFKLERDIAYLEKKYSRTCISDRE
jgi:hypothetical protein